MKVSNNFYIINTDEGFVLCNIETNEKFLIDEDTFQNLIKKDAGLNKDFQDAGIVSLNFKEWDSFEYGLIGKIFRNAISLTHADLKHFNGNEFWEDYLALCEETMENIEQLHIKKLGAEIKLPEHKKFECDFYDLLKKRRTIREFKPENINLQEFSDILFTTFGKFHESFEEQYIDASDVCWRRSSPSTGGLNCVEPYVIVQRVTGLEPGIYFYNSKKHTLNLVSKDFKEADLANGFLKQDFAINCAALIMFVGNLDLLSKKYPHIKAFTFPYLDVGHLAQTAILTSTALGLKNWISAAICDEYFIDLLKLEKYQLPLEGVCIGHGIDEALGPNIRKKIKAVVDAKFNLGMKMMNKVKAKAKR